MEEKLKVRVFRHKTYKNVFLTRNWCVCGACSDTYKTTDNLLSAIENANNPYHMERSKFDSFFRDNMTVEFTLKKEMEFDGYSGTLEKKVNLKVTDFEEVILTEE